MGRAPCCDKTNVKRGPWSPEEDATLKSYIHQNGTGGNWIALPPKIGLKRCGKSCRLRWLNYLRPNLRHGGFSEQEDNLICNLYLSIGSRWSIIAAQLPGRTDNDIKNYWNTRLKKKLLGQQQKKEDQIMKKEKERSSQQYQPIINWPHLSTTTTTTITPSQDQNQEPIISFQKYPHDHKYEISPTSHVSGYINLYDHIHFDHDLYNYSTQHMIGSTMIYDPHYNVDYNVDVDQTIMVGDMFDELLSNYPIDHVVEDDHDDDRQLMITTSQTRTDDWSSALNYDDEQVNNNESCWEEMDPADLVYSPNLANAIDHQQQYYYSSCQHHNKDTSLFKGQGSMIISQDRSI